MENLRLGQWKLENHLGKPLYSIAERIRGSLRCIMQMTVLPAEIMLTNCLLILLGNRRWRIILIAGEVPKNMYGFQQPITPSPTTYAHVYDGQ